MAEEDVEKNWSEFWAPMLYREAQKRAGDGRTIRAVSIVGDRVTVDLEVLDQIKRELFDWHNAMGEVRKAYSELTGGNISKPNTAAHHVIAFAADEAKARQDDLVLDALVDLDTDDTIDDVDARGKVIDQLLEHFDLTRDQLTDYAKERLHMQALVTQSVGQSVEQCESVYQPRGWANGIRCVMKPDHDVVNGVRSDIVEHTDGTHRWDNAELVRLTRPANAPRAE